MKLKRKQRKLNKRETGARWLLFAYLHLVQVKDREVLLAGVCLAPVYGENVAEIPRNRPPHPEKTVKKINIKILTNNIPIQ